MRIFILTRGYPANDRIYNHAFVHSRVLAYRALGHEVCVWWLRHRGAAEPYDFDGVPVLKGGPDACLAALSAFAPDAVAAHAPADDFWPVLAHLPKDLPVDGWIYGSEILPFYQTTERADHDAARFAKARATFERRIAFWRELAADWPENLRLVFVSRHAAGAAEQALGCSIPRVAILPSGIDTHLFAAHPKPADQRFAVLSIRPFSDWRYANDLSVAAILRLRAHPLFTRFTFHFVGEGRLLDEVLAPVRHLPNVTVDRHFVPQDDIAALHRRHGVLLCPSRDDAQGVTRDQAMASGLVPVVSRAGAVPEFVDEDSGLLTEAENPQNIADALARLADDPALFARLSTGAARRIRATLAMDDIVARELQLLSERTFA